MRHTIRFATPELEEQDRQETARRREEIRRTMLTRAMQSWRFDNCTHGNSTCNHCAVDFMLDRGPAALIEIEAKLVANFDARPFIPQIGGCWRILVGPALAARVAEIVAIPEDEFARYDLPAMVAEEPWLEVMCIGGSGLADDVKAALVTPVNVAAKTSYRTPRITIPVDYLLAHGERTT